MHHALGRNNINYFGEIISNNIYILYLLWKPCEFWNQFLFPKILWRIKDNYNVYNAVNRKVN